MTFKDFLKEEAAPGPWYVYILHFDKPYKHAMHYLGITNDPDRRFKEHNSGQGGRLPAVVRQNNIDFEMFILGKYNTYEEAKTREKHLKEKYKKPSRYCPKCREILKGAKNEKELTTGR